MVLSSTRLPSQEAPIFTRLKLSFAEDRCDVLAPSEQVAAVLNMKSFRSLVGLQIAHLIRFEGSVNSQSWLQAVDLSNASADSRYSSIDVLVFGYRFEADVVAANLAASGFFLQDPDHIPPGFCYENPQCLDLPAISFGDFSIIEAPAVQEGLPEDDLALTQTDDFLLDFDRILDVFACQDGLVQASAVPQISTALLSHQKEGLDFILQRETNSTLSSRTLWEQRQTENGLSLFQHVITGAKSPTVKDCAGGIVADEMGLGKSLTMLSAIAGSLDRGFAYARAMTNVGSTGQGVIAAKSTLVLVPSALLMDSWIEEINRHITPGALSHYKFHGQSRKIDYPLLLQYDVILTTYGTVAADFARNRSLLHLVHWYRIVLDEAVSALQSHVRWCLTGTPIQNELDDLGSLIRFLKLPLLEDAAQFKRHITMPIQQKKANRGSDYTNLRALLSSVCLRRTKAVLPITQSTTYTYWLDFTMEEREKYSRIERVCKEALDLAVSGHKVKEAHQNVLEILLQLRLFCNNGSVYDEECTPSSPKSMDPGEAFSLLQQSDQATCYYCSCDIMSIAGSDNHDSAVLTRCRRAICSDCIPLWRSETGKREQCPICRSTHSQESAVAERNEDVLSPNKCPSKLLALCRDIETHKDEGKSVVFSFWKKSLDIAGNLLKAQNIPFLRVDGSLLFSKRKTALTQFQERSDVPVLLMTLGTGAVGLNSLSVANRIHILEPQWNPSVESQAIGRVVRLGQERPVTIVRYIMNKTVEKSVQNRQFRKLQLTYGGFASGKSNITKQKVEKLRVC
ncbi:hypothetical protein EJ04DRAFT_539274 [Polyplosphaeria fusca]|uniref:Uncharacterized protein n=1 Tax=Polyplosphaeria fusca TaxID=682080 RepID=A0A9P4QGC4_9PLEO|nr:hypothetical protein EJ04DRAFT_539274 [Polyplosphaeria fusca]